MKPPILIDSICGVFACLGFAKKTSTAREQQQWQKLGIKFIKSDPKIAACVKMCGCVS